MVKLAAESNCSLTAPMSEDYCNGLEAIVYHGWTVSRSFVSFINPVSGLLVLSGVFNRRM